MNRINIGLLGYGVVNTGVHDIIDGNREKWKQELNLDVKVVAIAVKHPERHLDIQKFLLSGSELCRNPKVDIIIEAINDNCHKDWLIEAMSLGKHVITANKQLVSQYFHELISIAKLNQVKFCFEASVGGAIPIVDTLLNQKLIQDIYEIRGVFNGTCNFVLSQIEKGLKYEEAIQLAKEKGFAENDPSLDLNGTDSAHKLLIMSHLILQVDLTLNDIEIQGIDNLQADFIRNAYKNMRRVKLVGCISTKSGILEVKPQVLTQSDPLYWLENEENGIIVTGSHSGEIFLKGKGAGRYPTANAMIQNFISFAKSDLEVEI